MTQALEGIKILDFSQALMAPLASMMLCDLGAEVIKIEKLDGEAVRWGGISGAKMDTINIKKEIKTESAMFMSGNRGKKSLALDLKHELAKDIVFKLVKNADVFLDNFRPGVMDRLGFGYDAVSKINPKIIYCTVTGYGDEGPLAHRRGGDMWAQAMSGVVSVQGNPDGPPYLTGPAFIDQGGATLIAFGILAALFSREQTGEGQWITTNSINAAMQLQNFEISTYLLDDKLCTKQGRAGATFTPPYGAYRAKDGDVVTIFGIGPQWPKFCKIIGLEHLVNDPRFENDEIRRKNREALYPLLDEAFSKKTMAEWQQIFREARMRIDPCLNYKELVEHPQIEANDMITTVEHPVRGPLKMVGVPVKLKKTPGKPQGPAPSLGQHTEDILMEIGYSKEEIYKLIDKKVVKAN